MSSVLKPTAVAMPGGSLGIPFASYAQIARMLVPPAERISFHDSRGEALWINDGVEEPEFRMHVELSIARARHARQHSLEQPQPAASAEHTSHPSFVFAIRNPAGVVVGALGIECRDLPATARYRNADAVAAMLAPLLEILGHAWPPVVEKPASSAATRDTGTRQAASAASKLQPSMPMPALLRKTLSLATELIDCSFGAVILPDRPFTLSQRVSPDESDLAITAAIDNVRAHVLRWAQIRQDPLVVNTARGQKLPYKLLALPVCDSSQRVAALLILFRHARARDFVGVDVDELAQIAARIPADTLSALEAAARAEKAPVAKQEAVAPKAPSAVVATREPAKSREEPKPPAAPVNEKTPAPPLLVTAEPRIQTVTTPLLTKPVAAPRIPQPSPAQHMTMDARVRTALREGGFDLYAQKISPLKGGNQPPRFEVLLRMREDGKLHTPATFFNAAENSRLLPELDCWVIGALLKTLRRRAVTVRTTGLEFSVNITGQSLATDQFSEFIVAEVCRSGIPAGLLVFEISERTALEHEDAMEVLSARLRDVGCRIALDNCRSGLGTLDPLNKWPVSRVKIDASLIRNIGVSARSTSQVRAVAQIAADRGIETVAEGVETQVIHDRLLDLGIDYAQGFHLGRPEPLQGLFQ